MNSIIPVFRLSGKANRVFESLRLAAIFRGETTLGELARDKEDEAGRTLADIKPERGEE